MLVVGATVTDVGREFQTRVERLEPVVAAFMWYDARANRVSITTLLDEIDHAAEEHLASVELHLNRSFQDFSFDFQTIHLKGRNPDDFVESEHAVMLVRRHPRQRADAKQR